MRYLLIWLVVVLLAGCSESTSKPPPPQLEVTGDSCDRMNEAEVICSGNVRNITDRPIKDVVVLVFMGTRDAPLPVTGQSAPVDVNPLLPGQDVPWAVHFDYNPGHTSWSVFFQHITGQTIPHTPSEIPTPPHR